MHKIVFIYLLFVFTNLNAQIVFKQKSIYNTEKFKDTTYSFIKYKIGKLYKVKCNENLEYWHFINNKLFEIERFIINNASRKYEFNGVSKYFYTKNFVLDDMKHNEEYVFLDSNVTTYYKYDEYINGNRVYKKRFEELKNGTLTQIDTFYYDKTDYNISIRKFIIISKNGIDLQIPIFFKDGNHLLFSLTSEDGINYRGFYPSLDESDNEVKIKMKLSFKIGENEIFVNKEVFGEDKFHSRTFVSKITFDSKRIYLHTKTKDTEEILEITSNKPNCWNYYKNYIIIQ